MNLPGTFQRHPWPMVARPEPPAVGATRRVGFYLVRHREVEDAWPARTVYEVIAVGGDEVLAYSTNWQHLCAEIGWYPDDTVGGQADSRRRHAQRFYTSTTFNLRGQIWNVVGAGITTDWAAVLHLQRGAERITISVDANNTILSERPSCRSSRTSAASITSPSRATDSSTGSGSKAPPPSITSSERPSSKATSSASIKAATELGPGSPSSPTGARTSSSTPAPDPTNTADAAATTATTPAGQIDLFG